MRLYLSPAVLFLLMLVASALAVIGLLAFATRRGWLEEWMFKSATYGILMPLIGILGGWSVARLLGLMTTAP